MSKTYEQILEELKITFENTVKAWSSLEQYQKTPQSKDITLSDWNTLIELLGRTDTYVRAVYPLIAGLGGLGSTLLSDIRDEKTAIESIKNEVQNKYIKDISVDGAKLTATTNDGTEIVASGDLRYVKSVAKTASQGTVDTYTITFTDDTTFTFNVHNGMSVAENIVDETYELALTMLPYVAYTAMHVKTNVVLDFGRDTSGLAEMWNVVFKTGDTIAVSIPDTVVWSVAEPVFEPNRTYWLSFAPFGEQIIGVWSVV